MNHPAKDAAARDRLVAPLRRRLDELEAMPPGAMLVTGLQALEAQHLDSASAVRVRALWERVNRWSTAKAMVATCSAVDGVGDLPGLTSLEQTQVVTQELASALQVSVGTASNEICLMLQVAADMPQSWMALDRGNLSIAHLRSLYKETHCAGHEVIQAVDAKLVPLAIERGWTPAQLAMHAKKLVITLHPEGAAERAAEAKKGSDVRFRPEADETATVTAYGDAVSLRDVMNAINDRAEQMGRDGDVRPVGQRRVAALGEAVLGEPADIVVATDDDGSTTAVVPAERPTRQWRRRRDALVRIDLATLMRQNDSAAELEGYGAITAETARRIASDSNLRRLVTDPVTGEAIDLSADRYRPSQLQRDFIAGRDGVCMLPGCNRPARDCEADHRVEYGEAGGKTAVWNLIDLCGFHHDFKTKKLWHVELNPDGSLTWTSALGFTYVRYPEPFPMEPLPSDDAAMPDLDDRILAADPDPPRPDDPLPDAPEITIEEFYDYLEEADRELYAYANSCDYDDLIALRSFGGPTRSTS
ncbi:MAG: DUF222 domain-containing protein [Frankiaceae bacterium]|nr:DUF222 domain-containing protein [Frankiaceae bacterium]MBV9872694.1 DUF222 domain-containing protein [Frankiaceae bacterium]